MDALCQVAKGQDQGVPGCEQVQKKYSINLHFYSNYTLKYANPYDIILDFNSILCYLHVSYIFQLINYRQITKKCD